MGINRSHMRGAREPHPGVLPGGGSILEKAWWWRLDTVYLVWLRRKRDTGVELSRGYKAVLCWLEIGLEETKVPQNLLYVRFCARISF